MSQTIIKILSFSMMPISGFFVIKILSNSNEKIYRLKNILAIIFMTALTGLIYQTEYNSLITILNFIAMILGYKVIFKMPIFETVFYSFTILVFCFISDLIMFFIMSVFFSNVDTRSVGLVFLLGNFIVGVFTTLLAMLKINKRIVNYFIKKLGGINKNSTIIIIIFWLISITITIYVLSVSVISRSSLMICVFIELSFISLILIVFKEKVSNISLNEKFENLFSYIQDVEKWMEEEQFNLHEYKNQMAVIKTMTKNKKVNNYIDNIIKFNNNDLITFQLKELPTGGIKGLIYYKMILAKQYNLNILINISKNINKSFKYVSIDDTKKICKILGVYLDNAIEAARETEQKNVSLEIYSSKSLLHIVISNSINSVPDLSKIDKKGVSTKGKGRGNGLYFANKLIQENNMFSGETQIINNYYVQKLVIKVK